MASMTVQGMRDYLRSYLDTDSNELPNSLIDVWRDEATSRIQRAFESWDFYAGSWTLTTSSQSTAFSSVDSTADVISSVEGADWLLHGIPHEAAVRKYAWGSQTGIPIEFSVRASTLWLWPAPSQSASYTVRGYRKPVAASVSTDTVDLPIEFHPLVCEWMLARGYERQDDEIMSTQKFGRFEQELELLRRRYVRPPSAGIQSVGQDRALPGLPARLMYDFEANQ